jgi:hypothetical protein
MGMVVDSYLLKPDGQKFRTRLDGEIPPKGSMWVITNGIDTVTFPHDDPQWYNKKNSAVDQLLRHDYKGKPVDV